MKQDRHIQEDINQTLTYDQAKIDFANRGKIFNLVDCSHMSVHSNNYQAEKYTSQRSDFWIYETDTSTGGSISPVYVDYQPKYAHKIDTDAVSEARLKYIKKQANKKGLSLVDYAGGKRKIVSWTCDLQQNSFRFTSHCLQRYWQRSKMGNGVNWFKDFPMDTVRWLFPYAQVNDENGHPEKILRQYVPYEDGVFVAEILMTYRSTLRIDHMDKKTILKEPTDISLPNVGIFGSVGANCITFLHNNELSKYQKLMVKAINDRNKERYEQLIRDDKLASYKVMI